MTGTHMKRVGSRRYRHRQGGRRNYSPFILRLPLTAEPEAASWIVPTPGAKPFLPQKFTGGRL
jgi:hypothetical protein